MKNQEPWDSWPEDRDSYTSPSDKPTPKWRGRSVYKLRLMQDRLSDASKGIRALRAFSEQVDAQIHQEVSEMLDKVVCLGQHPCTQSPTLACIYDSEDDPSKDSCLFCDLPDERK